MLRITVIRMWQQRGSAPGCSSCAHAAFTPPVCSATTPRQPATRPVSIPTPPPSSIPPRTLPKPSCPPTQYHAPPAPQYQSSPLTLYPTSSTTQGDTSFTNPVLMPLPMSPRNLCHIFVDRGRRSLPHSSLTRIRHARQCNTHVPTLRMSPPTTPTTMQRPFPRRAQHLPMSSIPLQTILPPRTPVRTKLEDDVT